MCWYRYGRAVTSFPAQARRVRDRELALQDRLLALRECVTHFGPYGFRATWHHLIVSAGIPQRLEDDPAALERALAELEEARVLWAAYRDAFAERRRQEKALGRRTPRRSERWYSWHRIAYCPDPTRHPRDRLAAVVQRVMDNYRTGADWSAMCPACGRDRLEAELCSHCGVAPPGPVITLPIDLAPWAESQWRQIWHRTAYME